jgi:hypothetical protein
MQLVILIFLTTQGSAALFAQMNNLKYDVRRFNLGFSMGMTIADLKVEMNELEDYNPDKHSGLRRLVAKPMPGINLGLINNLKLAKHWDLRFIPAVSLTQRNLLFYKGDSVVKKRVEAAYAELPLMVRYKSKFHQNYRFYVLTGIKPGINMASGKRVRDNPDLIKIEPADLSWEFGFGFDIYGDRLKLAPEFKYSLGLRNVYIPEFTTYGNAISTITTSTFVFSLHFE